MYVYGINIVEIVVREGKMVGKSNFKEIVDMNNEAKRLPILFYLDGSILVKNPNALKYINREITRFVEVLKKDGIYRNGIDIAVVIAGKNDGLVQNFAEIYKLNKLNLKACEGERVSLKEGIEQALDLLEERCKQYSKYRFEYYTPYIVVIMGRSAWQETILEEVAKCIYGLDLDERVASPINKDVINHEWYRYLVGTSEMKQMSVYEGREVSLLLGVVQNDEQRNVKMDYININRAIREKELKQDNVDVDYYDPEKNMNR